MMVGGNRFVDDDGSVFESAIDRLATAGVTQGCNPPVNDRFCPERSVSRGEMAAFLVRAMGYVDDGGGDRFVDDDDSVFESAIDKLATAGVTQGCNPPVNDRFCPGDNVTRGQMAAFLESRLGVVAHRTCGRPAETPHTPVAASSIIRGAEATHGNSMSIPAPKAGRVGASWLRRGWAKRIGRIVLVLAAIVGVPVLVVWFTGGQSSVIYWIDVAMFSLFAYTIGFWPLWVVLVVPLGLVTWVVGKFSTVAAERIGRYFTPVIWILGGTSVFLVMGPTPGEGVALPTGLPRVGALLVMLGASLLSAGLLIAVRRIQMPTQDLAPIAISRSVAPLPWHAMPRDRGAHGGILVARGDGGLARLAMDRLCAAGCRQRVDHPALRGLV